MKIKILIWHTYKIIRNYITLGNALLYAFFWLIFFLISNKDKNSLLHLMGGIKMADKMAGLPLMEILEWLLIISIPVMYTLNKFQEKIDKNFWIEFSRFYSLQEWWMANCIGIWCENVFYVLIGVLEWKLIYGYGDEKVLQKIVYVFWVLSLYLILLSMVSIVIFMICNSPKAGMFIILITGIIIVFCLNGKDEFNLILGSMGMAIQFWGAKNKILYLNTVYMVSLIAFAAFCGKRCLKKYVEERRK